MTSPRNAYIDRLRGVAILLVVSGHSLAYGGYWSLVLPHWFQMQIIYASYYGVTIFFAVSGYLITSEFNRVSPKEHFSIDLKEFYVKRIGRIMPPLLFLIAFSYTVAVAQGATLRLTDISDCLFYILTLDVASMVKLTPGIDASYSVLWSLAIEEQFYIAFPIIIAVLSSRKNVLIFLFIVILYELIAKSLGYGNMLPVVTFGQIAIGCLGAIVVAKVRSRVLPWLRWVRLGGVALLLGLLLSFDWQSWEGPFMIGLSTLFILIGSPDTDRRSPLVMRVLERIGQLSYEIYLIHKVVLFETGHLNNFRSVHQLTSLVDLLIYTVLLVIIFVLASFFSAFVSVPCNRFIRMTFLTHSATTPMFRNSATVDSIL